MSKTRKTAIEVQCRAIAILSQTKEEENRKLVTRWKLEAAEYTIVARTEPETLLSLKGEPALHWTNPVREADDGLVFFDGPLWQSTFARMSDHSLSAHHRDRLVWEVAKSTDNGNPSNAFYSRWDVGPRP